jgi:hypothetical protein
MSEEIKRVEFIDLKNKVDSIYRAVVGDEMRIGIRNEIDQLKEFRRKQEKRNNMAAGAYGFLLLLLTVWQAIKQFIIKS